MAQDNQPDLQVEGWLKTLGIESLCQWDVLVFLYRHQPTLVRAEHIARLLGDATAEVVAVAGQPGILRTRAAFAGLPRSALVPIDRTCGPYASRRLGAAHDPR